MITTKVCDLERRKAILGLIAVCVATLLLYFGSDYRFGYLKTHTILSIGTILAMSAYGFFRIAFWLQCITDYNNKTKLW